MLKRNNMGPYPCRVWSFQNIRRPKGFWVKTHTGRALRRKACFFHMTGVDDMSHVVNGDGGLRLGNWDGPGPNLHGKRCNARHVQQIDILSCYETSMFSWHIFSKNTLSAVLSPHLTPYHRFWGTASQGFATLGVHVFQLLRDLERE